MKKVITFCVIVIGIWLTLSIRPAIAQQSIPVGPGDGDSHNTPIGGIAVLAALGGGYAIKKLSNNSHKP